MPSLVELRAIGLVAVALGTIGCASSRGGPGAEPAAEPTPVVDDRPLQSAGRRCQGASCQCRPVDAYGKTEGADHADAEQVLAAEGAPAEGTKRFEFRTGRGTDQVKITIEGRGAFQKSGAAGEVEPSCGYVDLPPGKHRVSVHVVPGAGQQAVTPKLLIYELGRLTGSWYATFGVTCGESQTCTLDELKGVMKGLHRDRGLFDPCGSVKVRTPHWRADKSADQLLTSYDLDLQLEVYRFDPRSPRGATCAAPRRE